MLQRATTAVSGSCPCNSTVTALGNRIGSNRTGTSKITNSGDDKQFFLLVEQVDGASSSQRQGRGLIIDDDLPPDANVIFCSSFEQDGAL